MPHLLTVPTPPQATAIRAFRDGGFNLGRNVLSEVLGDRISFVESDPFMRTGILVYGGSESLLTRSTLCLHNEGQHNSRKIGILLLRTMVPSVAEIKRVGQCSHHCIHA